MIRFLIVTVSILFSMNGFSQDFTSEGMKLKLEKITYDQGIVWGFTFMDAENIIFTSRSGNIKTINLTTKKIIEVSGGPKPLVSDQGGLMDVALHPNFAKNHWVYLTYTCGDDNAVTSCLGRGELRDGKLLRFKQIFRAEPPFGTAKNVASRLAWGKGNFLFMTMGDHHDTARDQAQKLNSDTGKLLRLTAEGKPAPGNPFEKIKDARPEIYSYGHRNPEGLFYDKQTDTLWGQEHGAKGGDEINKITAGANYGWPVIAYGVNYDGTQINGGLQTKPGMEQPVHYWDPSIAPSGLVIYRGKALEAWQGDMFSGALKLTHLNRLRFKDGKVASEERLLEKAHYRIRDVREGLDGWLYFSTDSGEIFRIVKQ